LQGAQWLASHCRYAGASHAMRNPCSTLALTSDRLGIYPTIQLD
jgi:hypothetical protein